MQIKSIAGAHFHADFHGRERTFANDVNGVDIPDIDAREPDRRSLHQASGIFKIGPQMDLLAERAHRTAHHEDQYGQRDTCNQDGDSDA